MSHLFQFVTAEFGRAVSKCLYYKMLHFEVNVQCSGQANVMTLKMRHGALKHVLKQFVHYVTFLSDHTKQLLSKSDIILNGFKMDTLLSLSSSLLPFLSITISLQNSSSQAFFSSGSFLRLHWVLQRRRSSKTCSIKTSVKLSNEI